MKDHRPLSKTHPLMKFAKKALELVDEKREPIVYLVDGRTMRRLNKRFRNKNKATDVLSFDFPEDFPIAKNEPLPLGEIYLNPKYIKENNETMEYLLLHGMLHLVGFNHDKKSARIKMERMEKEILGKTNKSKLIQSFN